MSKLGRQVLIGGALLLVLLVAVNVATTLSWGHSFGFGSSMMGVWMLIFWVVVIGGLVELAQVFARGLSNPSMPPGESPSEILKKRYSRGEIPKEQFERIKHDLAG